MHQGHVRYIGVSNWAAWQISKALGLSARHGLSTFALLEAYYSIVGRDLERDVIPMLESEDLSLLVWSPLAGGLVNGKVTRHQQSEESTRRSAMQFLPVYMPRAYDVIDALKELAEQKGASVAQLAIAWLLHQSRVSSVIIGARRIDQLTANFGAVDVGSSSVELQKLNGVSQLPVEYAGWMLGMRGQARAEQLAQAKKHASHE